MPALSKLKAQTTAVAVAAQLFLHNYAACGLWLVAINSRAELLTSGTHHGSWIHCTTQPLTHLYRGTVLLQGISIICFCSIVHAVQYYGPDDEAKVPRSTSYALSEPTLNSTEVQITVQD